MKFDFWNSKITPICLLSAMAAIVYCASQKHPIPATHGGLIETLERRCDNLESDVQIFRVRCTTIQQEIDVMKIQRNKDIDDTVATLNRVIESISKVARIAVPGFDLTSTNLNK